MFKHCSETEKVDLHYFYEMLIWSISHINIQNRPFFCSCLKRNGFTYVNIGRLVLGEAKELTGKWCLVVLHKPLCIMFTTLGETWKWCNKKLISPTKKEDYAWPFFKKNSTSLHENKALFGNIEKLYEVFY